jgi:hypothetical protein
VVCVDGKTCGCREARRWRSLARPPSSPLPQRQRKGQGGSVPRAAVARVPSRPTRGQIRPARTSPIQRAQIGARLLVSIPSGESSLLSLPHPRALHQAPPPRALAAAPSTISTSSDCCSTVRDASGACRGGEARCGREAQAGNARHVRRNRGKVTGREAACFLPPLSGKGQPAWPASSGEAGEAGVGGGACCGCAPLCPPPKSGRRSWASCRRYRRGT